MFYALVDSAALKNPEVLNNYKQLKVTIQFEPQSSTSKYHYNFLMQFPNNVLDKAITGIQKEMLYSWYTFFWNDKVLNIVFDKKKFEISLPNGWNSSKIKEAQEFGRSQSIKEEYLNFKDYFKPYEDMVRKLIK